MSSLERYGENSVAIPEGAEVRPLAPIRTEADTGGRTRRDLRLDFFRGLSLFLIFFDHAAGRGPAGSQTFLTHFVYFDAAEIFVFIAGYTACLVYGRSMQQRGVLDATRRIYRRVGQIYVANVALAIACFAILYFIGHKVELSDFTARLDDTLLLRSWFWPLSLLPIYMFFLGIFPVVLLLLRRNVLMVGCLSAILYGLALTFHWWLSFISTGFDVLDWQFLFVIGACVSYARRSERRPIAVPPWLPVAAMIASGIFLIVHLDAVSTWIFGPEPSWRLVSDKAELAVFRLANFLALAGVVAHFMAQDSPLLRYRALRPIILCGQHSLPMFCLGLVITVITRPVFISSDIGLGIKVLVAMVAVLAMLGAAWGLNWHRAALASSHKSSQALR